MIMMYLLPQLTVILFGLGLTRGHNPYLAPDHHVEKRQVNPFDTSIFFKYRWVTQCGTSSIYPDNEHSIQVSSTLTVPDEILEKASRLVYLVTRFMPKSLFQSLSQNLTVGIFVYRQDAPSAFPEYTDKRDRPECAGLCDAECTNTCVEDGTKFDEQWFYEGPRILVSAQNLNCDKNLFDDPQFGLLNLLVSELAKVTERRLPFSSSDALYQSFLSALNNDGWMSSTAMTSARDYFVQGSLAWFSSTRLADRTTGGMNFCGEEVCRTEESSRQRIQDVDPSLFNLLNRVYNNGRAYIQGGISVCTW